VGIAVPEVFYYFLSENALVEWEDGRCSVGRPRATVAASPASLSHYRLTSSPRAVGAQVPQPWFGLPPCPL